jgi:hypothetical protein
VTHKPVSGAKVYVSEFPSNIALTSASGSFELQPNRRWELVTLGTDRRPAYRLVVESDGHMSAERNWYIGENRPQRFELRSEPKSERSE